MQELLFLFGPDITEHPADLLPDVDLEPHDLVELFFRRGKAAAGDVVRQAISNDRPRGRCSAPGALPSGVA
jgi:hypothetical protein